MSNPPSLPEPLAVAEMVERHVNMEIDQASRYQNRELFDGPGIHNLHALAAHIYAMGHEAGVQVEREKQWKQQSREAAELVRKGADT